MKDETKKWLIYAEENLDSAKILLESDLYNPTLQNVQQSVEKFLKALCIESDLKFRKTHSINEIVSLLAAKKLETGLAPDECDLLDSIYLPSKYPLTSVLPDFEPDVKICRKCVTIAENLQQTVYKMIK
ncbi:MAG: HEPN domain-containing protein [Sedimentisphaerales bacterium]|jgi:HEPN domain-containing protein